MVFGRGHVEMAAPTLFNQNNSIMKRLEDFTSEDLAQFRSEICLNSLFYTDYENSFGINRNSASLFFDSYLSFICELAAEDGFKWDFPMNGYPKPEHSWEEFLQKYDTIDNLEDWHGCYEDFSWVEYDEEEEYEYELAA